MVDPETKDIYITDAGNYVTPGALYCFDKYGKKNGCNVRATFPGTSRWFPFTSRTVHSLIRCCSSNEKTLLKTDMIKWMSLLVYKFLNQCKGIT